MQKTQNILSAMLMLVLVTFSAKAQDSLSQAPLSGFAEAAATVKSGAQFGQVNVSAAKGRWWVWTQADTGYQQVYGGPRFNAGPVEVGVGAGAENIGSHWRLGAYNYYSKGKFSQLNLWEHGASGFWFRNESNVAVTKRFSAGAFGQRNAGWGGRAAIKFRSSELWGVLAGQRTGPTLLFGLRRYF